MKLARLQELQRLKKQIEDRDRASRPSYATPGALAQALDPTTVQTPALELIDQALVELVNTPDGRLVISMPPQEGKSQRASRRFPLWVLQRWPTTRVAIASYEHGMARRWGRDIRNDIATHGQHLGIHVRRDTSAANEWALQRHGGGVYSVGVGGALTGRPVELLVIDDPIKDREQANSETFRDKVWDWWTNVGRTRLAPGAPVVLILTRWHEDDLAGRLLAADGGDEWRVINLPAEADHDPNKGETDPLGREPGEYMQSSRGRTEKQWRTIRRDVGSTVWTALYQGRPTPPEGGIFKRHWWSRYDTPLWIERADGTMVAPNVDEVAMSWDMAFKDTDHSDYVVGQVWARRGMHVYLLDQVRDRMTFVETQHAVRRLAAKWPQATAKYVEDKANGTAVINALSKTVPGLIPVEPDGSKQARAEAVAPFVEAGQVHLPGPELAPWAEAFVDEHAAFPNAAHDDQVDATTQALNRLLLAPILDGDLIVEPGDLDDDVDDSYSISPI